MADQDERTPALCDERRRVVYRTFKENPVCLDIIGFGGRRMPELLFHKLFELLGPETMQPLYGLTFCPCARNKIKRDIVYFATPGNDPDKIFQKNCEEDAGGRNCNIQINVERGHDNAVVGTQPQVDIDPNNLSPQRE
jgi:hypothetical protein